MLLTVLATQLAEAVAKDMHPDQGGCDIAAGVFGKSVGTWLRDVAGEIAQDQVELNRRSHAIGRLRERVFELETDPQSGDPIPLAKPRHVGMRQALYVDSTPHLHIGDSAFEDWFQQQPFACQPGIKQIARDAYAAGMGDPLVVAKT